MKFDKNTKILIVGLGLIGGSYAKALSDEGYFVGAIDKKKSSVEYALKNGLIQVGETSVKKDFVKDFDLIVFALYPHDFINWIKEYQSSIKSGALITDVTGVKSFVVENVQKILRGDLEFVGAHPMAGKEVSGVENADSKLNVQKASRISEQATPEQLFATAQKKLKLGLSYDAFQAIDSAYKLEPDNEIYKVYHAYTSFLINPSNRDEAIEIISVIAHDLRDRAKFETKIRDKVFAPYYFLGKLYLAAERYDEANEALSFASKLDPSDIDTQRSLRYIAMQIEKRQIPEAKGFFARLKDKLST